MIVWGLTYISSKLQMHKINAWTELNRLKSNLHHDCQAVNILDRHISWSINVSLTIAVLFSRYMEVIWVTAPFSVHGSNLSHCAVRCQILTGWRDCCSLVLIKTDSYPVSSSMNWMAVTNPSSFPLQWHILRKTIKPSSSVLPTLQVPHPSLILISSQRHPSLYLPLAPSTHLRLFSAPSTHHHTSPYHPQPILVSPLSTIHLPRLSLSTIHPPSSRPLAPSTHPHLSSQYPRSILISPLSTFDSSLYLHLSSSTYSHPFS